MQKNLLRYFFSDGLVCAHMPREPVDGALVALVARIERRLASSGEIVKQFFIIARRLCHPYAGLVWASDYELTCQNENLPENFWGWPTPSPLAGLGACLSRRSSAAACGRWPGEQRGGCGHQFRPH